MRDQEKYLKYQKEWTRNHPHYRRNRLRKNPEARKRQAEYYEKWYAENKRKRATDYILKIQEWRKQNLKKVKACILLRYALKVGKVKKPEKCEMCGKFKKLNGHHWNYENPKKVTWVCHSCHKKIHSLLNNS